MYEGWVGRGKKMYVSTEQMKKLDLVFNRWVS